MLERQDPGFSVSVDLLPGRSTGDDPDLSVGSARSDTVVDSLPAAAILLSGALRISGIPDSRFGNSGGCPPENGDRIAVAAEEGPCGQQAPDRGHQPQGRHGEQPELQGRSLASEPDDDQKYQPDGQSALYEERRHPVRGGLLRAGADHLVQRPVEFAEHLREVAVDFLLLHVHEAEAAQPRGVNQIAASVGCSAFRRGIFVRGQVQAVHFI